MQQKPDLRAFLLGALILFSFSVVYSVTAVEFSLFLCLIALLSVKYREDSLREAIPLLRGNPLFIPWMLYLGVCLLTALTAYYPSKGLGQLNSDFLKYVCLSTLLLAVKKEHLPRLSAVYIVAAALSSVFGICEALRPLLSGEQLARAGVLMNAVRYGEAMAIALLLVISRLVLPARPPFRRERLFLFVALGIIFTALALTQTRGAWLGLATGLAAIFLLSPGSRKKVSALALLMVIAAASGSASSLSLRSRFSAMAELSRGRVSAERSNFGISVRLELWKLGYKMFRAHPVLGVGPANVKKVFKKFHPDPFPEEGIYGTLNSIYVHHAAERGSLGLAALLFLFWAMLRFALRRFKETASPYALWALCALPAFYVMNLTEISFQHVHTSFAIFLAISFAAAAEKSEV